MQVEIGSSIREHLLQSAEVKRRTAESCEEVILRSAEMVAECFRARGRLLLCGNGGSAADCQHIAAEFVSALTLDFVRPALGAIALTTDTSFLTANANDFGFEHIFARQVEALGQEGDVLLGISTSGGSVNVVRAMLAARQVGMHTLAFTGSRGGPVADAADLSVRVPSDSTPHVQEAHIAIGHILCDLVERMLFGR